MITYKLKIRQPGQWFYRTYTLKGQSLIREIDKLVLEKADGTFYEMPEVSKCHFKYGADFFKAREAMQKAQENKNDVPST